MDPCAPTITGDERINCDIRQLNTGFVEALEDLYDVINRKFTKVPNIYRNRIPRGAYALGHTLDRSIITHHAGMGDQAGLEKWETIRVSDPDTDYDACRYQAHVVDSGFSRVSYTGYHTERRTKNICLNDIKWLWQYQQQINAYFSFLGDVTARIWETWGRENYMMFCTHYVLSDAGADGVEVEYNPRTSPDVVLPNVTMSTLKWEYLEWYHQMLSLGCPEGAIGHDGGFPLYGLVMHPKDWHYMIENDPKLRETYNHAMPTTLLDHYGSAPTYKGFMIVGDMEAPRWRIDGQEAGGDLECTRIVPYIQKKVTKGVKWVANPEYVNAEIGYGAIFLNDVYTTLVPPSGPSTLGGGTEFGTSPGLMGEFQWLNIQSEDKNLLRENGFYFARFQAFAEPGENHTEPIGFFYKRCTAIEADVCPTPSDGVATAVLVDALFAEEVITAVTDVGEKLSMDTGEVAGGSPVMADQEILSGQVGLTVATAVDVSPGGNCTLSDEDDALTEAKVVMVGADGKTIIVESALQNADFDAASFIRPEGPNELRLTLAGNLACGAGAPVTVTQDNGTTEVAGVIAESTDAPTYVLAFAAGTTPAYADMGVAVATVICV